MNFLGRKNSVVDNSIFGFKLENLLIYAFHYEHSHFFWWRMGKFEDLYSWLNPSWFHLWGRSQQWLNFVLIIGFPILKPTWWIHLQKGNKRGEKILLYQWPYSNFSTLTDTVTLWLTFKCHIELSRKFCWSCFLPTSIVWNDDEKNNLVENFTNRLL